MELDTYPATDADLIRFADRRYRYPGLREQAIRDEFGITPTRFFQVVNGILDSPSRIVELPPELGPVVKRLREQRERQAQRRRPLRSVADPR